MAIVCHAYRFIFIKTRKTAGSSVEIALSRLCKPNDLITPLGFPDGEEETLRRDTGGQPPVNWQKPWWRYRLGKELRHRIKYGHRAMVLGTHATAADIKAYFGPEVWRSYYRITIERNPWDRAISRYWWMRYRSFRRGASSYPPLSEFLERVARERPHWLTNWGHYTLDGQIAVDRVLQYEDLASEMERLESELGAPSGSLELPMKRAKGGFREDKRHYSEVLSRADADLISRVCRNEIEAFGYRFSDTKA